MAFSFIAMLDWLIVCGRWAIHWNGCSTWFERRRLQIYLNLMSFLVYSNQTKVGTLTGNNMLIMMNYSWLQWITDSFFNSIQLDIWRIWICAHSSVINRAMEELNSLILIITISAVKKKLILSPSSTIVIVIVIEKTIL